MPLGPFGQQMQQLQNPIAYKMHEASCIFCIYDCKQQITISVFGHAALPHVQFSVSQQPVVL